MKLEINQITEACSCNLSNTNCLYQQPLNYLLSSGLMAFLNSIKVRTLLGNNICLLRIEILSHLYRVIKFCLNSDILN